MARKIPMILPLLLLAGSSTFALADPPRHGHHEHRHGSSCPYRRSVHERRHVHGFHHGYLRHPHGFHQGYLRHPRHGRRHHHVKHGYYPGYRATVSVHSPDLSVHYRHRR